MKFEYLNFFFKEGFRNIIRNSSITFISITLITVSLFIIGIMFSISNTLSYFIGSLQEAPSIIFFLSDTADLTQKENFIDILRNESVINKIEFSGKDDAYDTVAGDENIKNLLDIYGRDILPESISVYTSNIQPDELKVLYGRLMDHDIIESGFIQSSLIDIVAYINKIGFNIFLIFSFLVILIVGNAIRLSVLSKEKEILLKRLTGSTENFIRIPFMFEGILKGLFGGGFANFIFLGVFLFKHILFPAEIYKYISLITPVQGGYLILFGGIFGWLGSIISTSIYIKR